MYHLSRFAFVLLCLAGAQASAATLCERLYVPDDIGLECVVDVPEAGGNDGKITVKPDGGPFVDLSRMSVRQLDRTDDGKAWLDPEEWLESQLTLDFTNVVGALEDLADDPDNPLAGSGFSTVVTSFRQLLTGFGNLPLTGCEPVHRRSSQTRALNCLWGIEPITLQLEVRLIGSGEARYASNLWSMNEKRMRHFQAIANSFTAEANR